MSDEDWYTMGMFRDDREAMLARANALERQLAESKERAAEAEENEAAFAARAADAEKELTKLRKKLAKLEPPPGEAKAKANAQNARVVVLVSGVLLLIAVGAAATMRNAASHSKAHEPGETFAPPALATTPTGDRKPTPPAFTGEEVRIYLHSAVLDDLDVPLRLLWRSYQAHRSREGRLFGRLAMSWFEAGKALETLTALSLNTTRLTEYAAVDTAGDAYAPLAREALKTLNEALRYIEHKDQLEDGGAKGEVLAAALDDLMPKVLDEGRQYRAALEPAYRAFLGKVPEVRLDRLDVVVKVWQGCRELALAQLANEPDRDQVRPLLTECEQQTAPLLDSEAMARTGNSYILGLFDNIVRESKDVLRSEGSPRIGDLSSLAQSYVYAARQFEPR